MNYPDINKKLTLPSRQRSLFNILPAAIMAAKKGKLQIAVMHAPIYVDEHVDSEHVFCPYIALDTLYPKHEGVVCTLDAMVEANGSVFLCVVDDALLVAAQAKEAA